MTGEVKVVTDPEEKKALFEKLDPLVKGMYQSWDNPIFEIIYMDHPACKIAKGFAPTESVE